MVTLTDLPADVLWLVMREVLLVFMSEQYPWLERCVDDDLHLLEECRWFFNDGPCAKFLIKLAKVCPKVRRILRSKTNFSETGFSFKKGVFSNPI